EKSRPLPVTHIHPHGAQRILFVMHRSPSDAVMFRSRERAQSHRRIRRTSRRRAGLAHAAPSLLRAYADRRQLAHLSLTGAHRGSGVALQRLDPIEPLRHTLLQILRGDIITEANKSSLVGRTPWSAADALVGLSAAGHSAHRGNMRRPIHRNKRAPRSVPSEPPASLRNQTRVRHAMSTDHDEVA